MSVHPSETGDRLVQRLLDKAGATPEAPPAGERWPEFLERTRVLLADLSQDRYLLERSLRHSTDELEQANHRLQEAARGLAGEREELRHANSLLTATLESTNDGIVVVGHDHRITSLNARFLELWGLGPDVVPGVETGPVLRQVVAKVRNEAAFTESQRRFEEDVTGSSLEVFELRDGRYLERASLPQMIDGRCVGRVWSFRDVTEQRRLERELSHRVFHDHLTDLATRALLCEHIDQCLARRPAGGGRLAVIVVDLDGFKLINDSLGHLVGDELLVAVSRRFVRRLVGFDTIARIGGDEFAMLIDGLTGPVDAQAAGQSIIEALAEPLEVGSRTVAVSASVGIALSGDGPTSADELLGNADAAMYRAKRDGKACFRIFEASMHTSVLERLDLEQALRDAVANRALTIQYQPVVATATGGIVGFEALARWIHPERGPIPPDVFIPLAEEIGLILEIGRYMLYEACRQAVVWHRRFPVLRPTVAVNVSRLQFTDPGFVGDVAAALAAAGLEPRALTLELTETILSAEPGYVIGALDRLRSTGVRIAIDDFGTGYSSLAALADLPVDDLKIDKRFIHNVLRDDRGRAFVEAITQLAHTLGLHTVAEGVELPEQRDALRALGCDLIQGYLYSRPLPVEDTYAYLAAEGVAGAGSGTAVRPLDPSVA